MLYNNITEKLLGLQGVNIENIEEKENNIYIFIKLKLREHKCPCCGEKTVKIHDYRKQKIKDIPAFGKKIYLIVNKRRYVCKHCKKRFLENNNFLPKYYRMTNRLAVYVINQLRNEHSFTSIAKQYNLSVSTVIRIFDIISYPKPKLPKALSIDEFKGNTGKNKYQCIITDPLNKKVLDILPTRYDSDLTRYFASFDRNSRLSVDYFVSDMWKTFSNSCDTWFKNATKIVDKYHWIRQVVWAFEAVRKVVQKQFNKSHRIYFKNSRKLLIKHYNDLNDEQKTQVMVMLDCSPTLSSAYFIKEDFFKFYKSENIETCKKDFFDWIEYARESDIKSFVKCAKTFENWSSGILNSLKIPLTNGFTEGCNNKIKVLKRNAYGYRNFNRFRNRILFMFDK